MPNSINREGHFRKLPKAVREFNSFLDLIIDETFMKLPGEFTPTWIRCHKKGCEGAVSTKIDFDEDTIHWKCSTCPTSGNITNIYGSEEG